jgi:oligopeptide transport system ATP-binding protein
VGEAVTVQFKSLCTEAPLDAPRPAHGKDPIDHEDCRPSKPLLEVQDLQVEFRRPGAVTLAVRGLSFRVRAGRTLAIVGESGSGKTAACRSLMGLLPETATVSGKAYLNGTDLLSLDSTAMRRRRGADVAMIFQDPTRSLNPTMRIGHQIIEAIRLHTPIPASEARARAVELLQRLDVPDSERRFFAFPHELSGGLRQRAMIAIAVAARPRLLIADEATRSLDVVTRHETLALLKALQRELGMAILMVSHDLNLALQFADDVLVMYAGQAVESAPAAHLAGAARMRYTQALLDANPDPTRPPHTLLPEIPGQPTALDTCSHGCAFHLRCYSATAICAAEAPPRRVGLLRHWWACWHPAEPGVSLGNR